MMLQQQRQQLDGDSRECCGASESSETLTEKGTLCLNPSFARELASTVCRGDVSGDAVSSPHLPRFAEPHLELQRDTEAASGSGSCCSLDRIGSISVPLHRTNIYHESDRQRNSELLDNTEKRPVDELSLASSPSNDEVPTKDAPTDAGIISTPASRLKRKKAVKIKRSKTDEICKRLVLKKCISLLEVDRKVPEINPLSLSDRHSVSHRGDILRLAISNSEKSLQSGGESDYDVVGGAVSREDSCFSPPAEEDASLGDCFSPTENPLQVESNPGNSSQFFDVGSNARMDGRKSEGAGTSWKDNGKDCVELESERRKSMIAPWSSPEGAKEVSLLEDVATKRGVVFRRKSSLVEEDRKPTTKRIFGTSKKSLQLLRKYSLASEYFTLKFENGEEQMVAAIKGSPLCMVVADVFQRRGLNVDQADIFLESSKTPLPLTSDSFLLANTLLWVKAKEEIKAAADGCLRNSASVSNLPVSLNSTDSTKEKKASNTSIKNKKSVSSEDSLPYDVSPYGSLSRIDLHKYRGSTGPGSGAMVGTPGQMKGHSKLQSLFSPFSKVQDKQEQLNELLNGYSLKGLPKMPDLLTLGRPHYDLRVFHLESHWTDIVANHHLLNKRQRDQQEAIWELLTTEVEYIHKLKVIMDLFMCCLFNLQNEQILNEIEADKLFSNIGDVFYATCHFWNIHMSQVLKQARGRRELLNPCLLKAGFLVFEKIFDPYTKYCLEQDNCRQYIKQKTKENDLFRTFILWAESQKQCNRLKLVDLIVKPFQRLTKYKLLLYAMKKPLEKMDVTTDVEEQKSDISTMIEQVENFVFKVNVAMRQRHDYKQMSQMIERIESYDAIEAPSEECVKLVSKFCKLDLTCPMPGCGQQMRILLLEGSLKLRDTYSKMDVYCFLFTDMLLITKPAAKRGDRVKVIKPPMRLDKIVVHSLRDVASFMLLYLNEYHVAQAVYTFHGDSKLWLENVIKAQNEYKEKRHNFLMRTDLYDDVEDECAIYIEHVSASDTNRHDSSGSADTFLPNYKVQRSTSCLEDQNQEDALLPDITRPSSAFQPRVQSYQTQLSVPFFRSGKDSSSESLTGEVKDSRFLTVPSVSSEKSGDDLQGMDYGSNDELENVNRSKLRSNQRRGGRGERRYRTADTIQDLKNRKDRSIQKRLSWNCGNAASNLEEKEKLLGGESLRSMPSSSGVSSTASLQIAVENETLDRVPLLDDDEEEGSLEDVAQSKSCHSLTGFPESSPHPKTVSVETQTMASDWQKVLALNEEEERMAWDGTESFRSRSLPNIAGLMTLSNGLEEDSMGDRGVDLPPASVPSTPVVTQRRRLSNSPHLFDINQELMIFDSTLEASEV